MITFSGQIWIKFMIENYTNDHLICYFEYQNNKKRHNRSGSQAWIKYDRTTGVVTLSLFSFSF